MSILDNISNKKFLIRRYLDQLDKTEDSNIIYELFQLYLLSNRKFIAFSFADMIKNIYPNANEYVNERNNLGDIQYPEVTNTIDICPNNNTIAIASNSCYFPILLNCLTSIYKNTLLSISNILIYDIGLKTHQVDFLNSLKYVSVIKSNYPFSFYEWKFNILCDALKNHKQILYLDAGCYIEKDLTPLFHHISENKYLIFNHHEDKSNLLKNWTSEKVYNAFNLKKSQCDKITSIATLMGFTQDALYIVDEVLKYNTNYLLRPHSDCIDNRFDQSLSSVIFKYILNLNFQNFNDCLSDLYDHGSKSPYITIHKSKLTLENNHQHLLRK